MKDNQKQKLPIDSKSGNQKKDSQTLSDQKKQDQTSHKTARGRNMDGEKTDELRAPEKVKDNTKTQRDNDMDNEADIDRKGQKGRKENNDLKDNKTGTTSKNKH